MVHLLVLSLRSLLLSTLHGFDVSTIVTMHKIQQVIQAISLTVGACTRVTIVVLCVYVCVYVSVTMLAATYLVYKSQVRCYKVPYGISNVKNLCGFR